MQSTMGASTFTERSNWLGSGCSAELARAGAKSSAAIAKISFIFFTERGALSGLQFLTGNIISGESFQPLAAQADLDRFIQCLIFTPTLVNDAQDHHECADPIGAGTVDQHRVVGLVASQPKKLVGLFRARRCAVHRNVEIAQLGLFHLRALTDQIDAFTGSAQAQDRMKAASGSFDVGVVGGLCSGGKVFVQAQYPRHVRTQDFLDLIQTRPLRFRGFRCAGGDSDAETNDGDDCQKGFHGDRAQQWFYSLNKPAAVLPRIAVLSVSEQDAWRTILSDSVRFAAVLHSSG